MNIESGIIIQPSFFYLTQNLNLKAILSFLSKQLPPRKILIIVLNVKEISDILETRRELLREFNEI